MRHLTISSCLCICTLLLYAAHFHPDMSPRIHPLIIRGRFPPRHVAAYTPSYYTRHISTLTCRRVYTLLLYAADFHPDMSPRIHPLIIRGTFTCCRVAAYTPSYYTRHFSTLACRRVCTLLLYVALFHILKRRCLFSYPRLLFFFPSLFHLSFSLGLSSFIPYRLRHQPQ